MREIINGKKYDTNTAKEVAFYCNDGTWRDFNHYEETLYRKRTGEYFIYGEGGPATRYAESVGTNCYVGGEKIFPMTYVEAKKWAERHLDVDDYEAEFGEVVEDDSKTQFCVSMSTTSAEAVHQMAMEAGITVGELIERLIK